MLDQAIMATGSMEAAMQFCLDNAVSVTDIPSPGTVYQVSDAAIALGDRGVFVGIYNEGIIIGTLGSAPGEVDILTEEGDVMLSEDGTPIVMEG